MTLQRVLENVQDFYQSCSEYTDTGRSKICFTGENIDFVNTVKFSTAFHRDHTFVLSFETSCGDMPGARVTIESDMRKTQVHDCNRTKSYDCLDTALKVNAGTSSRVTTLVPRLLLRPTEAMSWLRQFAITGEDENGFIILSSACKQREISIDPSTFALRRVIFRRTQAGDNWLSRLSKRVTYRGAEIRETVAVHTEHEYLTN